MNTKEIHGYMQSVDDLYLQIVPGYAQRRLDMTRIYAIVT